ncbi:hypothetical protein [Streptomyces sp. NPDC051704]|uniref:hypothetical protein n=1 Tax=Streptomyces sp. NPDC051704 TaxID=3365671 RepID=UPI00379074E5
MPAGPATPGSAPDPAGHPGRDTGPASGASSVAVPLPASGATGHRSPEAAVRIVRAARNSARRGPHPTGATAPKAAAAEVPAAPGVPEGQAVFRPITGTGPPEPPGPPGPPSRPAGGQAVFRPIAARTPRVPSYGAAEPDGGTGAPEQAGPAPEWGIPPGIPSPAPEEEASQ